jgi:uncharacterized protein (DUF169 family)
MNIKDQLDDLKCALNIKRGLVGVKFIFTRDEFDGIEIEPMKGKGSYCFMVKRASMGRPVKANRENLSCGGGAKALGLEAPDNDAVSGRHYHSFKLYNSLGTARAVQEDVTFIGHGIYGVLIRPLGDFDVEPDVVIIILNPYQAMRMVQGYAYHYGALKNIKMTGNQGICSECTATPYVTNDLNISALCSGTRLLAKWDASEMGIGMPFNMFGNIAEGVMNTLNPTEPDHTKREIFDRAKEQGRNIKIEFRNNYYSNLPGRRIIFKPVGESCSWK